jgi:diguanylate cyclase (GGDEF)-like protein
LHFVATAPDISCETGEPGDLNHLVVKLDHYIQRSERLSLINQLHTRLAGTIDVPSMIEAFSIWLMPLVEHNLLAYDNPIRGRKHLFCSCHGPERNAVRTLAINNFSPLRKKIFDEYQVEAGYGICKWRLEAPGGSGLLLLLHKKKRLDVAHTRLMDEALSVLREALQRALDYEDLFEQARCDALTGLPNRRVFEDRIFPLMDSASRHGHPLTLASMDLDGFKQINDTLGHAEGDEVLRRIAKTLQLLVRTCDLLVRMGGDEFLLVLPDTPLDDAKVLASRLRNSVRNLKVISAHGHRLDISIGLVQWERDFNLELWLELADAKLYEAKAAGRNRTGQESAP